jgi:choline monooxygenase
MSINADPMQSQRLENALTLPAECYVRTDWIHAENTQVFASSWQLVAHVSQLEGSGDHIVRDWGGLPIIVLRDAEGALRGFHNVCRHRAGPLALCDGLGAKALRCRYHGWTYGLDGVLKKATEMTGAADFDPTTVRLPELRVATWHGLVFVAHPGAPDLTDIVSGMDTVLGSLSPAHYRYHQRYSYDVACNWKVYVDNYLEGYHVPHIHPGLNSLLDYRDYITATGKWFSYQLSPLSSDDALYGDGSALYYFIYPNTMLNLLPGRLQSNRVVPLGVDRCRVEFDYFYNDAQRANAAADHAFADQVQSEDIAICEQVQRGLASGSYRAGRLNPGRENALHHFHELLRIAYQRAALP